MPKKILLSKQIFRPSITLDDLVEEVSSNYDYDVIVEFIKQLDAECEDWEVTEQLYNHFAKLYERYIALVKEI